MSTSSNVPALTITTTGASVPATEDILNGVLQDLNSAFGGNLNITNVATPQAYLAENITNYLTTLNFSLAYLLNQIDPLYAEGRWQDAIGRLYFMTRNPATATVVSCDLIGQPGSTLNAGALATDGTYSYQSLGTVTFSTGGTAAVEFACTTLGAIACPANTLNRIALAAPGWDAINNLSAGVVGNDVENRVDFEYRRQQSVAQNANSSSQSIIGAVSDVSGVLDCYVYENFTNAAVTVGNTSYSVPAHSIYIAAVGGVDADVATAIWTKKSIGCSTVGNTAVTVTDTSSLASPQPTYSINFERPDALPIYFAVRIADHPNVPSNIVELTRDAIINAFNGGDGEGRARIASDIYASRFYQDVIAISPYVKLLSILIGTTSTPTLTEVLVGIDQVPTIDATNISVTLV
jgi:hypothetical protein